MKLTDKNININSLGNKFDMLTNRVTGYIAIVMISETKLDDIFLHDIYHLQEFSNPYGLYRNFHGGGILIHIRDKLDQNLVLDTFDKETPIKQKYI